MTHSPSTNAAGGDFFWRAMPAPEVAIFSGPSGTYGRRAGKPPEGIPELLGMNTMKAKACARFFTSKENAVAWAKTQGADAKVLAVPRSGLIQGRDFDVWPKTNDVYIDGAIAQNLGILHDPDKVP